jgi:hypothetical protein
MLAARGDLIVFADADMATPPSELPKLVAALASADVALGSRIQPGRVRHGGSQPAYRGPGRPLPHCSPRSGLSADVQDTQCGFKGFTRDAAHDIFALQKITSIVFDVELIHLAAGAATGSPWCRRAGRTCAVRACARGPCWPCGRLGPFRIPLLHRDVRRRP